MEQKQFNIEDAEKIMNGVMSGKIQTRDGYPVRILTMNIKNRYCVGGVVSLGDTEYLKQWTANGKSDYRTNVTTRFDLFLEVEEGGKE